MPKQLNVNLAFTSDTNKVKQDLQELQNMLSRLTVNSAQKSPLGITNEIKTAISDVSKLEVALKKATTSTGSLDLSQFRTELNQAGLSAEKIATQLTNLGPEGKRAFAQLTQSVMSAEIPLKQTSTLLSNFATTLKNTARWQISSSILHGFMGSIQGAYTYAQNLNKSLNNIRIVTGKSADEMADFAEQANNAAQALSTTTTEYTNASLIYYQQGLDDDAVKERTDATVKMANVTRESAEEVSQQMTAIWNNFDDGSKSLEYYSDVVTALGAATASSSAEIAEGLEKFASVADTVGLSYEYATAALATVTATTRQSADIVGNAFKTLFARMEGLKLGETLDDGTDLNKYSKALDAVGISIKTTDGELKQMDQILDELGSKWQTLTKDQQMALAQTVAGVRQYTQLVALMENYDFFKQNVRIAKDAEGTLQEQFEIYEESWEAAKKRLTASMQDIYKSLIDEKFFTNLTDSFGKIASSIAKVVESFGGLKGLLPGISAILLKTFGPELATSMSNFAANIQNFGKSGIEAALKQRESFSQELINMQVGGSISSDAIASVYQKQGEVENHLIQKKRELLALDKDLSSEEKLLFDTSMEYLDSLGQIKIKEAEKLEILQNQTNELEKQIINDVKNYAKKTNSSFNTEEFENDLYEYAEIEKTLGRIVALREQYADISDDEQGVEVLKQIDAQYEEIIADTDLSIERVNELIRAFEKFKESKNEDTRNINLTELDAEIEQTQEEAEELSIKLKDSFVKASNEGVDVFKDKLGQLILTVQDFNKTKKGSEEQSAAFENVGDAAQRLREILRNSLKDIEDIIGKDNQSIKSLKDNIKEVILALDSFNKVKGTAGEAAAYDAVTKAIDKLRSSAKTTSTEINNAIKTNETEIDNIRTKIDEVGNVSEKTGNQWTNTAIAGNNYAQAVDNIDQAIARFQGEIPTLSQKIVAFGGVLSSFAMTLQSINSIINTIENPDLSDWEKFINIAMSLGMIIPSILNIYKQLNTIFKDNSAQISILNKKKQELTVSDIAETEATEINTKTTQKNTEAKKENASVNELVTETNETVTASATAATAATAIFVAIIAVAIGALFLYTKAQERAGKAKMEAAKAASAAAEEYRDELEANKEILISYEELLDKYKKGEAQKSEMYDATVELAKAYDIEGSAIVNLTGQYDEFIDKVKKASKAKLDEQKKLEKEAYQKNAEGMVGAGIASKGMYDYIREFGLEGEYNYTIKDAGFLETLFHPIKTSEKEQSKIKAYSNVIGELIDPDKLTNGKGLTFDIEDTSDPKQIIKFYEDIQEYRRQLVEDFKIPITDATIIDLDKQLETFEPYYKEVLDHAKEYNKILIQEVSESENIINASTEKDVERIAQRIKKQLIDNGLNIVDGETDELIDEYLQDLGTDAINKYLAKKELLAEGISKKVADAFLNANITDAEREQMFELGFKIDHYKTEQEIDEAIEDFKTLIKSKSFETSIPVDLTLAINETITKGKTVNKETWESLVASAPNAEDILGDRNEFNNKSIAERIRLMNELNKVLLEQNQEVIELDEAQKAAAERRLNETKDQIKKQEDYINKLIEQRDHFGYDKYDQYTKAIEKANEELNKLLETQQKLNEFVEDSNYDAGVSALNNTINSLLSDLGFVQTGVELIGENWTVAAENVEQFASLMPEILGDIEELQFLEDGSLKLNKEQVAMILNGNEKILESNKEIVIDAIKNKIAQLQAENEFCQKQIELLKDTLQHHQNYNKNLKEMDKNTQEYADQLKELGVEVDTQAWDKIIDNSAKGSEKVQENLEKIYNRIQEIHEAYGKMLTKDNLNGYNIEGVTNTSLGNGEWRASVSAEDIDKYWNDKQVEAFQDQITQYQETIEKNEDLIASYTGAIAKIKSGVKEFSDSVDLVNSGKAGKKEKEKKTKKESKPDKKDLVDIDKELDRYYDINNAIAKINQELERQEQIEKKLSTYQQHYAGKTLIASLQKQNDLLKEKNGILEKQYQNYQKLYEIQRQELSELKGKIGGSWNGDELQNYAELFQANVERYNAVVETYNAMTKEQQDASGKQMIEDAKKAYDTYKDALERYQTLYYNEMYDTENKLAEYRQQQLENQMKIIENNLKAWETDIQLKLDMTKLKRDWKAFMKDVETDFRKIYKNLVKDARADKDIFGTYAEDAETRIKQIQDVEAEIRKMEASKDENGVVQITDDMMFGSISEAQEKLKELQSELVDVGNSLNDMYKQVWDSYIEGLEQAAKNFDDLNSKLDHLTKKLEFEKELIELVYGDKAYDMMNEYYEAQQNNIEAQIKSTRKQAEFWEDQFEKAYQMNKDKHNVNKDDMSTWTEDMKKAYDEMIKSQEKLNDLVIDGIKNLKDKYLNNVEKTLSDMDQKLFGMDFSKVKEDWDYMQREAKEYLNDTERAYKAQTLANKINKSISETSSLKAQQKLAKLREEEIKILREKENLTEDDVKLAEARYEIALKEIALEDAQANKTSMKLTRDTSGNWTYQYVADEEDVMAKQQELLDSYYNLYETADNAQKHAMELFMEYYEEYQDKLRAILTDPELMNDAEKRNAAIEELNSKYLGRMDAAMENSQIYRRDTEKATVGVLYETYKEDNGNYEYFTEEEKRLIDELKEQNIQDYSEISEAIDGNYNGLRDIADEVYKDVDDTSHTVVGDMIKDWDKENNDSVKGAMKDAFKFIKQYTKDYENELKELEKISGVNITDPGGVVDDIHKIEDEIEETAKLTDDLADTASDDLDELRGCVEEVERAWEDLIERIREAISALQEYLSIAEAAASVPTGPETPSYPDTPATPSTPETPSTPSEPKKEEKEENVKPYNPSWPWEPMEPSKPSKASDDGYEYYTDPDGVRNTLAITRKGKRITTLGYNGTTSAGGGFGRTKEYVLNKWAREQGYEEFHTGGYTGEWGASEGISEAKSGKLAILHQKELVLNTSDTANILSAVNIMRDIAGLNESINQTIANSIGKLIANAMAGGGSNTTEDNSSNVFNITAEFPNANDVQTIKDAILSLPNIASQYIHSN